MYKCSEPCYITFMVNAAQAAMAVEAAAVRLGVTPNEAQTRAAMDAARAQRTLNKAMAAAAVAIKETK